jgi:hypothetical protein
MKKTFVIIGLCFFLGVVSAMAQEAQTQDQDFSISAKLDGLNAYHDVAVSSKNGDAFVAWERRVTAGGNQVIDGLYGVLMKHKKNGKYKAKKVQTLWKTQKIDIGTGNKINDNYQFPKVEYNPVENNFLVVFYSGATNSAYAQVIKANGNKDGDPVLVMPGTEPGNPFAKDCTDINIYYIGGSEAPSASAPYLAIFDYDYRDDYTNWQTVPMGIHSAWLDSTGLMVTEPTPLFRSPIGAQRPNGGYCIPGYFVDSVIQTSDGGYLLGVAKPKLIDNDDDFYYTSYAAKLDKDARLVKTQKVGGFDSWGSTSIAKLSDELYVFVWMENWKRIKCGTSDYNNSYLDSDLKKKNKTVPIYNKETVFSAVVLNLGNDTRAYQLFAKHSDNAVYGRFINTDGSLGEPVKIFGFDGEYADIVAKPIPGTNDIFIAYGASYEETFLTDQEIRGHVFTAR